ncbi:dienelactone hydrolase family protein [Kitasatospora purpeofusca]|uniref:dienelactone hydrolase family protein n=1 Tax=Kitasatospora purpeofusca TaxID=67352 RepID=UPI0036651EF7
MCYESDAVPPVHGAAVTPVREAGPLVLTAADGTRFAAFLARPERPSGAAVVVLPDNNGLSPFYEALTERLAEQGHPALALDWFGRTAGPDLRDRGAEFTEPGNLLTHLMRLTPAGLDADITAAAAALRDDGDGGAVGRPVIALGFCFGGRQAFRAAAERFGLAGVIGFYGYPDAINGSPGPTQLAGDFTAPLLALWGGADEAVPPAAVAGFEQALDAAGCRYRSVVYPGAPHGFFEQGAADTAEACADSWRGVLAFLAEHGAGR